MEVYRYIRNDYRDTTIPVIVVTGLAEDTELRMEAEAAVTVDQKKGLRAKLLQKAVEVKELLALIKNFLATV
jgi:CheY-like chemotaxis protein